MRCGNHANIDLDGFRSAHSLEATFLYDTQQFDLGLRAELTDLVEKKRSSICTLETTAFAIRCPD
jgi:hypothetical protein